MDKNNFKQYVEQQETWKAKKSEIVEFWKGLRPGPIPVEPVPEHHKGTRFRTDGIRITGSPPFINGIISRLKDLIKFEEQPGTRLDIEYRQIESSEGNPLPEYVFYLHVLQDVDKGIQ